MAFNEDSVRAWLRRVWGPGLQWVEAGCGGSVGLPDVNMPVGDGIYLPCELKAWWFTSKGLRCEIRPAQIRYHTMLARDGGRSAFLIGIVNDRDFDIYAFPGGACPVTKYAPKLKIWKVGYDERLARDRLLGLIRSYSFWEI